MKKIHIGTSGFSYHHWHNGVFYPKDLKSGKELEYYVSQFDTVEINSSFYHLPSQKCFSGWYSRTPKAFVFSVKGSRFISHRKRLKDCQEPLKLFLERVGELKEKLGPILFQFSPTWEMNYGRLSDFLNLLPKDKRFTLEFRNPTWFNEKVFQLLKDFYVALTFSDTPNYPYVEGLTADFVYARLHGHEILYGSNYTPQQLKGWSEKTRGWTKGGLDVYIYFDNDAYGFAPKNALYLKKLLKL